MTFIASAWNGYSCLLYLIEGHDAGNYCILAQMTISLIAISIIAIMLIQQIVIWGELLSVH